MAEDEYTCSLAFQFDYRFGLNVAIARMNHELGVNHGLQALQSEYVEQLEALIARGFPQDGWVNDGDLREMIGIAQSGPWTDVETIKALYAARARIRDENYDKERFFPASRKMNSPE
jgi:hypothetical protein